MRNKIFTIEKIKNFLLKAVFICLLFLGLFFTFSPWLKEALIKQEVARYSLGNFTATEIQSNKENRLPSEEGFRVADPDFSTVLLNISKVSRENVVGAIIIHDLNVLLPILEGTNTHNLLVGATTVNNGQEMGKGNYILAGHHMKDNSLLFGSLLLIKTGTMIQLSDKEIIYSYEVTSIKLIHENDLSVLEDTKDPVLTLITCNVPGVNTDKRIIVFGQFIDKSNVEDDNPYVTSYKDSMASNVDVSKISEYLFFWWSIGIGLLTFLIWRGLMLLRL